MDYSIIGSGSVGIALARQFARSGIAVGIANTRGPASTAPAVTEFGGHVVPATLHEALRADVIILAVPFKAYPAVAAMLPDWSGKIVVDAMNTYGIAPETFKGRSSTAVVADSFPGAQVVKAFNYLVAAMLGRDPVEHGGRRVMFLAGDDARATATVGKLAGALGFAPVALGMLQSAAHLITFGGAGVAGPLVMQNFIRQD